MIGKMSIKSTYTTMRTLKMTGTSKMRDERLISGGTRMMHPQLDRMVSRIHQILTQAARVLLGMRMICPTMRAILQKTTKIMTRNLLVRSMTRQGMTRTSRTSCEVDITRSSRGRQF